MPLYSNPPKWTPFVRSRMPVTTADDVLANMPAGLAMTREQAERNAEHLTNAEVYLNSRYQVQVERGIDPGNGFPELIWLSVKRRDKKAFIGKDWRDLQRIKNEIVGPEHEAVELYPAESRLVDTSNQYHLWVLANPELRWPFGYQDREVVTEGQTGRPGKYGQRAMEDE
jgi:hypothetical protein